MSSFVFEMGRGIKEGGKSGKGLDEESGEGSCRDWRAQVSRESRAVSCSVKYDEMDCQSRGSW